MLLFLLFYTLTVNSQTIGKYAIVNGTIEFTSKANLETIKANSNELKGLIDPVSHSVAFRVANNSFLGFNSQLQLDHFNENYMETDLFSNCTFKGKIIDEVNFNKDGGFQFRSVHFFVNKKDDSSSPIVKLAPIMLSEDDVAAGFAVVTLPDVVTVADRKISINASVDNVAGLESNVSSVSVVVSNAIRPHAVEMVGAESCRESAVPVCVKVGVKDGAYVSVLARAEHDECWSTTNVLNVPATENNGSLCATVTSLGELGDELLPFVKYHFAAVQHGSSKCASDDVCTITGLMPDQSKLSNAVSAVPFADFRFSSQLSLASADALSLESATVLRTFSQYCSLVTIRPISVSECPAIYFVPACIDTSTPCSNERKKYGVPHVLSASTGMLRACAAAAIAGMSCISKVSEPGASQKTAVVFGLINREIPLPINGS